MKQAQAIRGGVYSCWPTPTTMMGGNRGEFCLGQSGMLILAAIDQKGSQVALSEAVRIWTMWWLASRAAGLKPVAPPRTYPFSHRLHLNLRSGTRSLHGALTFNPHFSDWIMGWPIGWSDPERPVTAWSRWRRRSRTALSELLLRMNESPI
jgi:hypothetical protein